MGLIRAFGRLWRAIILRISGNAENKADRMMENASAIRQEYREISTELQGELTTFRDSVGRMLAQKKSFEKKSDQHATEAERFGRIMRGAQAKAKAYADEKGLTKEQAQSDPQFVTLMSAYQDAKTSFDQETAAATNYANDAADMQKNLDSYMIQLQQKQRMVEQVAREGSTAEARAQAAQEKQRLAELQAGMSSQSSTTDRLNKIRGIVDQVESRAEVTAELAGTNTTALDAELEHYGEHGAAADQFMGDIFGTDGADDTSRAEHIEIGGGSGEDKPNA